MNTKTEVSTELVTTGSPAQGLAPNNFQELQEWSDSFAKSSLIARSLQKRPMDVMVVLQKGRELGLMPMQALENIHPIPTKGGIKLVTSADLMVGLCLRSGLCEYFEPVEADGQHAIFATKRMGRPEQKGDFTIERAKRAGLLSKDNWRNYPQEMLMARAKAGLARAVFPDVVGGLYADVEMIEADAPMSSREAAARPAVVKVTPVHSSDGEFTGPTPAAGAPKENAQPELAVVAASDPSSTDEWDFGSMNAS